MKDIKSWHFCTVLHVQNMGVSHGGVPQNLEWGITILLALQCEATVHAKCSKEFIKMPFQVKNLFLGSGPPQTPHPN